MAALDRTMDAHALPTALSSDIPISPSFIYLHHPYHSSGYALPAEIDHEVVRGDSTETSETQLDASGAEQSRKLTVKVDLGALSGEGSHGRSTGSTAIDAVSVPLSQKLFYNAVLRNAFAGIMNKVAILKARRSKAHQTDGTGTTPQKTQKNSKRKNARGIVDPFDAAVLAFGERFIPLAAKDVYRWDVFLTRIRHMVDAFGSIVEAYEQASESMAKGPPEEPGLSMALVVMESQLLHKCLEATWHALLRLNEMVCFTFPIMSQYLPQKADASVLGSADRFFPYYSRAVFASYMGRYQASEWGCTRAVPSISARTKQKR